MATPRQRQWAFALFFATFALSVTVLSLSDAVPALTKSVSNVLVAIGRRANNVLPITVERADIPWRFDKIGHAAVWGVGMLGMGLGLRKRLGLTTVAVLMVAVSFSFELLQGIFTATRSVSLDDGISNVAGIVIATIIVAIVGPLGDRLIARQARQHQLAA